MRRFASAVLSAAVLLMVVSCSAETKPVPPTPAIAEGEQASAFVVEHDARTSISWREVDDAARYLLVIVQDDGITWAWEGTETAVVLGGGPADRVGPGFALTAPASLWWSAVAEDGRVLASFRGVPIDSAQE